MSSVRLINLSENLRDSFLLAAFSSTDYQKSSILANKFMTKRLMALTSDSSVCLHFVSLA